MSSNNGDEAVWIVLLEVADTQGASTIDSAGFDRLVSTWASPGSTALYSRDRYALQIPVGAADPATALSSAMSRWKDAVQRTGVPRWALVRAEIMTPEELEREPIAADWRPLQESAEVVYRLHSDGEM